MRSILVILFVFIFSNISAQVLKGTIKDSSGEPLAYSTVYIRELQQGTTSNTKGNYEIHLPEGKYTVVFQSLGFAPDIREITLGKNIINLNIVLQTQYYEIPEVRITASGEDPAYGIMRKVIGLAPYYLNQISHYQAEVYLKGNLVIKKIPKLLQKSMKVEARDQAGNSVSSTTMKAGDSYLMESVNELEFNAPDKYIQRVISYQSTFPAEGNGISPMDFIQASFYQPVFGNMAISPLSPEAFSNYKFKYLGSSAQGNFFINKIQVTPKRKSQQLFEGTIFIIEDLWCLHSLDLVNENIAGKIRIQQVYIPVQENVWMPVSHKFEIEISIIGFKADAGYGSSIKYDSVTPNTFLKRPSFTGPFSSDKLLSRKKQEDTTVSKTKKQIEKILNKDELTNRDMIKLSGLMEKESKSNQSDSVKKSLEIKENIKHIIEKDASKKDSSYWIKIRPIPLSESEYKSLRVSDSLKAKLNMKGQKNDTLKTAGKRKSKIVKMLNNITFGHTWADTLGFSFVNGGLINFKKIYFNPVDGFVYGTDFRFSKSWKNGNRLSFYPDFLYAFSREQLMWSINSQYNFDRLHQRQIYFKTGMGSKDFNNNGGINVFLNSISSLLLKENWLKLYESRYFMTGYKSELTNGLYAEYNTTLEDRAILSNTTSYSLIKSSKDYSLNVPENPFLNNTTTIDNLLQNQKHADVAAILTYTPRQKYRIHDKVKVPMGSDWPTFTLTYKHGINESTQPTSSWKGYDLIKFEASKSSETGAFGQYFWIIRSGGFFNNSQIPFYDFFHFSSQQIPVLLNNYRDAFMLPGYYSLSTSEFFAEAHARYTNPYLFLKLLPGLSNTLIRENLSTSFLWSRYQKCYTEIGYSLSEIFLLGEIGVYAGFDNFRYKSTGVKLVLNFH
jgi:Family of unknown function (DUF5686)/CarboxypepD_reg-like domain